VAARGVDISVFGDKRLERALRELPVRIQNKVARKALRAGAKVIGDEARARVAVSSERTRPGRHLRDTIKVRAMKRSRAKFGFNVQTGRRIELGIPPDEKSYYPFSLEYGTAKAAAQPYMRPALETKGPPALARIKQQIVSGIEIEAAKLR